MKHLRPCLILFALVLAVPSGATQHSSGTDSVLTVEEVTWKLSCSSAWRGDNRSKVLNKPVLRVEARGISRFNPERRPFPDLKIGVWRRERSREDQT